MIDGIDVKECTCFSNWHTIMTGAGIVYKEIENCCTPKQKPCKDIKNCCFKKLAKQLTRKTQECEQAERKLERIREVLTNITEAGLCEAKECGCDDNKECLECTLNEIKDVIQIIDEVE